LSGSGAGVHSTADVVADITAELEKFPAHFTYDIKDPPKVRQVILKGEHRWDELSNNKKGAVVGSSVREDVERGSKTDKEKELEVNATVQKDTEITDAFEVNKENQKMKD
jgi:hypothetical protein